MGKESYLGVTGPRDAGELASRVREILDLPEGTLTDNGWETTVPSGTSPAIFVERSSPAVWDHTAYDYEVQFYTGELADDYGRRLFDGLASSTRWALCLINDGFATVAERPAVRQAS